MTDMHVPPTPTMEGAQSYRIEIDDLPQEIVTARSERELLAGVRDILEREDVSHVGSDVHMTITWPDGTSATCTVAEMRDATRPRG